MTTVYITNTLTGTKELFTPRRDGLVHMYVCGITPYDYAHIGHGRCYVTFDIVSRFLRSCGYTVSYCRNFTDIEDKLLTRAEQEHGDVAAFLRIADTYIQAYKQDMQALNCAEPDYEPRVTQVIPQIITFIQQLIDAGYAYAHEGDVYFSVTAYDGYGELSKRTLDEMQAGARVAVSHAKRHPADFALWKRNDRAPFWQSPWGRGRPGWHIECSVMAAEYLDIPLDIHAGGADLIFPHHENERAQSVCYHGTPLATYWMHNAFVRVDQEKMSKSEGNFFTLRDIFASYDPMVVRYMFISHHYRSPLDFSYAVLNDAQKAYTKLVRALEGISAASQLDTRDHRIAKMVDFLADDINTPGMLGVVFSYLSEIRADAAFAAQVKKILVDVCGLTLQPLRHAEQTVTPEIQNLIDERERARAARDWQRADALRDQLRQMGYEVHDKKL